MRNKFSGCIGPTHEIQLGLGSKFDWTDDHYLVVSCDPAIKNFAMRIEKRFKNGSIVLVACEKVDFSESTKIKWTKYEQLHNFLDKYREIFLDAHIFVVERQLPKSFQAMKMSHYALGYFISLRNYFRTGTNDPDSLKRYTGPVVMDISSTQKGHQLGSPKGCKKNWLKKWSALRAVQLFEARKDYKSLDMILTMKKKDDVADTAMQIEALFRILKLPLTENFNHDDTMSLDDVRKSKWPWAPKVIKEKVPKAKVAKVRAKRQNKINDFNEVIKLNLDPREPKLTILK